MTAPAQITLGLVDRDTLGRKVAEIWDDSLKALPVLKTGMAEDLSNMDEFQAACHESRCRIGEALFRLGRASVLAPVKAKRICAECGLQIGKRHKWHIGPDSRIRHRDCANPIKPNPLAA